MREFVIDQTKNQRLLLMSDVHYCFQDWYEIPTEKRMDLLCEAVNREYEERPFDAILGLGDFSMDFWIYNTKGSWLNEHPVSNTKNFVERIVPRLPMKPYMIPGNHEQYANALWEKFTGFPRQFSVVYGDKVFLMCDTFAGNLDPTEHSDGTYTGLDFCFLREALEKYPEKELILCMHDLIPEKESMDARELVGNSKRFFCGFAGHTHDSDSVILGREWNNLPVFYTGDFSFSLRCPENTAPNWGFRRLNFKNGFSTRYQPVLQLACAEPWRKMLEYNSQMTDC